MDAKSDAARLDPFLLPEPVRERCVEETVY